MCYSVRLLCVFAEDCPEERLSPSCPEETRATKGKAGGTNHVFVSSFIFLLLCTNFSLEVSFPLSFLPLQGDSISLDALSALIDTLPEDKPKPEPPKLRPEDIVSVKSTQMHTFVFVF